MESRANRYIEPTLVGLATILNVQPDVLHLDRKGGFNLGSLLYVTNLTETRQYVKTRSQLELINNTGGIVSLEPGETRVVDFRIRGDRFKAPLNVYWAETIGEVGKNKSNMKSIEVVFTGKMKKRPKSKARSKAKTVAADDSSAETDSSTPEKKKPKKSKAEKKEQKKSKAEKKEPISE